MIKNDRPTARSAHYENIVKERAEKRKEVLSTPYSYWTSIGIVVILIGAIIVGFGINSFIDSMSSDSRTESLFSFMLYGPSLIIIGLLVSIAGILSFMIGVNRRSEMRLEAIQFLSIEQSRYLKYLSSVVDATNRFGVNIASTDIEHGNYQDV